MPYAPAQDASFLTRRGLVFFLIVLLHIGMFWLLNSGLSHQLIDVVLGPIEIRMIDKPPDTDKPPPPPPPKIDTPPPFVPPPEISIELPAEAPTTTAITQTTSTRPVVQPVAPPAIPRTAPRSDPRRPISRPEYPPSSRRAGEAGTVTLELLILENGRVGEARIKQSSGYPRLDEAALREVKRSWRLLPATENGKPIQAWGQFAVTFKLTDG